MEIQISSRKYPGLTALVDSQFYEELSQYTWRVHTSNANLYAARSQRYPDGKQRTIFLHRDVLRLAGIPVPDGMFVDHENGNTFDCQLLNLRPATSSQNATNRKKRRGCTSQFYGVCLDRQTGKWDFDMTRRGEHIHRGTYEKETDAARVYDFAAGFEYGPYFRPNFPGMFSPEMQLEFYRQI